jgi:large subunit ribosomal protein L10
VKKALAISKDRKLALVKQYTELLSRNEGLVLASYSGLRVKDFQDLRAKIREIGGELYVVKNRLVKLAFEEVGLAIPEEALVGTTAIGFAGEELPAVAKAILDLARETEQVRIKGGVAQGEVLGARQVEQLAELPPLPVVQAKLLGLFQQPGRQVASLMASSVRQLVNVVHAYATSETQAEAAA